MLPRPDQGKMSRAARANISRGKMGHEVTKETREKIRAARLTQVVLPETGQKISAANTGKTRSPQSIARYKASWTPERRARHAEVVAQRWRDSLPWIPDSELYMVALLEYTGIEFDTQVVFGRYCVDFFLPASNAVIEVDGDWAWHRDTEREARRDEYLLERGVSFVNHVPTDLMWTWNAA